MDEENLTRFLKDCRNFTEGVTSYKPIIDYSPDYLYDTTSLNLKNFFVPSGLHSHYLIIGVKQNTQNINKVAKVLQSLILASTNSPFIFVDMMLIKDLGLEIVIKDGNCGLDDNFIYYEKRNYNGSKIVKFSYRPDLVYIEIPLISKLVRGRIWYPGINVEHIGAKCKTRDQISEVSFKFRPQISKVLNYSFNYDEEVSFEISLIAPIMSITISEVCAKCSSSYESDCSENYTYEMCEVCYRLCNTPQLSKIRFNGRSIIMKDVTRLLSKENAKYLWDIINMSTYTCDTQRKVQKNIRRVIREKYADYIYNKSDLLGYESESIIVNRTYLIHPYTETFECALENWDFIMDSISMSEFNNFTLEFERDIIPGAKININISNYSTGYLK